MPATSAIFSPRKGGSCDDDTGAGTCTQKIFVKVRHNLHLQDAWPNIVRQLSFAAFILARVVHDLAMDWLNGIQCRQCDAEEAEGELHRDDWMWKVLERCSDVEGIGNSRGSNAAILIQ
jgi:hypothetical protein